MKRKGKDNLKSIGEIIEVDRACYIYRTLGYIENPNIVTGKMYALREFSSMGKPFVVRGSTPEELIGKWRRES